ncbi:MAG: GNAT family N-acetyltransferase, partial [Nitrososphaeraceae archaeon]
MNIILTRPSLDIKEKVLDYWNEFKSYNESLFDDDKGIQIDTSYEKWLEKVTNDTCLSTVSEDWVVTDTFFAVRKTDNKIVGMCELRHCTNDVIKDFGQIGYDTRPTERKKGYATEMVKKLLEVALKSNMKEVFISVENTNIASIKIIE